MIHFHLLAKTSSSSSSSSFSPVFPRVRRWPDAPHSFSNRSHSLSPSRAICSFLHPQPNLLYILLDLFLPCLLRPSSLSWSIHFKYHCLLKNTLFKILSSSRDIVTKLMQQAAKGLFLNKDVLYQQVDSVTMGLPLRPTLANFFIANLETKMLQKQLDTHPKLYLRYVDDIFAIFESEKSCNLFLNLLNSQHNYIRFTIEKSTGIISYLDVAITINPMRFDTWIWRKPTYTGLLF